VNFSGQQFGSQPGFEGQQFGSQPAFGEMAGFEGQQGFGGQQQFGSRPEAGFGSSNPAAFPFANQAQGVPQQSFGPQPPLSARQRWRNPQQNQSFGQDQVPFPNGHQGQ